MSVKLCIDLCFLINESRGSLTVRKTLTDLGIKVIRMTLLGHSMLHFVSETNKCLENSLRTKNHILAFPRSRRASRRIRDFPR